MATTCHMTLSVPVRVASALRSARAPLAAAPRVGKRPAMRTRLAVTAGEGINASEVEVLGDRILIKRDEVDNKSAGGVILQDGAGADDEFTIGEVLGVGSDITLVVKKGDKVLVAGYGGTQVWYPRVVGISASSTAGVRTVSLLLKSFSSSKSFKANEGVQVKLGEESLHFVRDSDIMAVIS